MSEKLKACSEEEIGTLRKILQKGFVDSDEDWRIYKKFADIKRDLIAEGTLQTSDVTGAEA